MTPKTLFEASWKAYVLPLEDTKITLMKGKLNKVLEVNWGFIKRESSKGFISEVKIEDFKMVHDHIVNRGSVTRDYIHHGLHTRRVSSFIFAVLSRLPYFKSEGSTLRLDKSDPLFIEFNGGQDGTL